MRRALLAAAAFVVAFAAAARPAAAEDAGGAVPDPGEVNPASYAVVAIEVAGDADPELRAQVQAGLARGIARTGAGLIGYDEVQKLLAAKPALVGCLSTTCLASIAEVVGTPLFVRVSVTATGANYEVALELIGVEGPIRRRTASCTVCTVADLAELVATRVQDLIAATAPAPLPVEIATQPAGGTLQIPGAGRQPSPWKGALVPGEHAIVATKPGYLRAEQTITVADVGDEQRFEIALVAEPPRDRPAWPRWAVAGGAAAALLASGVLLTLDGNGTCDGDVTCPEVYDTATAGAVTGILGLAGAGVAAWMFTTDF